jgi:hypothetical protein
MRLATLEAIFRALEDASVRYLVVGGVAVNAHGYQRLTQDLDLVIELEASNLIRALDALADLGYKPLLPVAARDFADPNRRRDWIENRNLEVFSLVSERNRDTTIDLFAREPFDFAAEYSAAKVAPLGGNLAIRFVRLSTLIEMKDATGRPRDRDDADHLRQIQEMLRTDERE